MPASENKNTSALRQPSESLQSDAQLMAEVQAGNARAYRSVVDAHLQKILAYATRILKDAAEAEEVAQETFLRAWQNAGKYTPEAKLRTWLFRIAHNLCIDKIRKSGRRGESHLYDDELDAAPESQRPLDLLESKAVALSVQEAIDSLPERQKEALILCHEQGLSNPEIAAVLECKVEAVESLLARGRRKLREIFSQDHGAES